MELRMNTGRNTSAVVLDSDRAVGVDYDADIVAIARKSLVDRVVDYLIHKMMQTLYRCRTDIHTRTFTYALQSFKNLDLIVVIRRFHFFD